MRSSNASRPTLTAVSWPVVFLAAAGLVAAVSLYAGYRAGQGLDPAAVAGDDKSKAQAPLQDGGDRTSGKEQTKAAPELAWPRWAFQLKDPLPERQPPLTPPPWRILGATMTQGTWHLLILREGKAETEYFKVGDKLPGNYLITAISEEDVTLKHGKREMVLAYIGTP
ncbi:hypothetical protein H5407_03150 [Mitsuaria sp. WAJ17]|uniref:hypothetical protein n=1 Tax=Mitsuaria sp. WAJ17 TaxID=2761452 RepID=UPI001601716C|nr:hypothetical protein [Mitsuaria sp. WAJ17]MBB2484217.1 hypothetical protein [Mitsuaria sp. WAJ17]